MPQDNPQRRSVIPGQWFWLEKSAVRDRFAEIGRTAFAVYAFLASSADECQVCFPSQVRIATSLGLHRTTVCRAVRRLEKARFITLRTVSGRTHFTLLAISPRGSVDSPKGCCAGETDMSLQRTRDVALAHTNKNQRTRIFNNQLEKINSLASFLADSLHNPNGLPIYEAYARKYPEALLQKVLTEVRESPPSKIRKSRSHLFTYLLKKYAA